MATPQTLSTELGYLETVGKNLQTKTEKRFYHIVPASGLVIENAANELSGVTSQYPTQPMFRTYPEKMACFQVFRKCHPNQT